MKLRVIDRYILREFWPFFGLTFGITTVILFIQKIFRLAPLLVNNQMDWLAMLRLVIYTIMAVSGLTLPIAFLIACTLTFNRLSTDSEYLIMRASGLSFYRLLVPLLCLGIMMYGVSGAALMYGSPWGFQELKHLFYDVARNNVQSFLSPGELHQTFKDLVIYVKDSNPQTGRLEEVFIADSRTQPSHIITAQQGTLITSADRLQVTLSLEQGQLHRNGLNNQRYHLLSFDQYTVRLDLNTHVARWVSRSTKPREMFPSQLRQEIKRRQATGQDTSGLRAFLYKLFSLPFACILFAGLGPSLGIVQTRSGRSSGYIFGVGVILVYYIVLTLSDVYGRAIGFPIILASWIPNLVMGIITLWFLQRTERGAVRFSLPAVANGLHRVYSTLGFKTHRTSPPKTHQTNGSPYN